MTREPRSSVAVRWAGVAAMLGGSAWSLGFTYHASKPRGCIDEECLTAPMRAPTVLDGVLISAGMALISAGVVGLVLLIRRAGGVGALARVGLALGGAGIATLAVAGFVQERFFAGDFDHMPYYVVPGLAMVVVGFALLGVAVLRSRVLPTWVSVLLLLGTLAMIGANEQTERALLYLPFGIAWVAVGHALWSAPERTTPTLLTTD